MGESKNLVFYPFAYALLDDYLSEFCWYCLKESDENDSVRLLRCSGCKRAYFCSKSCQSNGWSDHKAECKGFPKWKCPNPPDIEIRMLGRLTWRYKQILDGHDEKMMNFYSNRQSVRNVMDLCNHVDEIRADPKAWKKFQDILKGLRGFYDGKFLPDDETIFQLHCRNFINRHGISDRTYLKEIGKGLYLDLCWYDHSCRPNSLYTHDGFVAILRPLSPAVHLADRSSTFYTYIDLLQSKEERKKALSESWYFDCQCSRCVDESDHALTSLKCAQCRSPISVFRGNRLKNVAEDLACSECGRILDESRLQQGVMAMRKIDSLINDNDLDKEGAPKLDDLLQEFSNILPRCNIYYVRLLRAAILKTDPEDVQRMLGYHEQALECMRICYPINHPSLAYHLMSIGIFYGQLDRKEKAREFLAEAKDMFRFTLGADHFLTRRVLDELEKVEIS